MLQLLLSLSNFPSTKQSNQYDDSIKIEEVMRVHSGYFLQTGHFLGHVLLLRNDELNYGSLKALKRNLIAVVLKQQILYQAPNIHKLDFQKTETPPKKQIFIILLINRIIFHRIINIKEQIMNLSSMHLFQQIHGGMIQLLQEVEHSSQKNYFTINKTQVQLLLTDHYLVLCENSYTQKPSHYCKLTFQVKFQVLYQKLTNDQSLGLPYAFKLERQGCSQQLTLAANHPKIIQSWSIELEKRINQRNFHKLFKAKKKIGKGAFATVYLAQRLRDGKMVAVKAFSKEKQYSGDKGKESLQNEIKLMRRLSHPNIMKLEGVYETENSIYVILEYLQGTQLNDLLKSQKKLKSQEIKEIIQNILRALGHLNKNRIIHRDLKPQNIMFRSTEGCDLAICDFGLATYADELKYLFVRCGTPGFVAPEIINIRDMATKSQPISDVFSAGIIFHYLLFGLSIFQGKKYNEILNQNRSCDFDFTKEIYQKFDVGTLELLTKMLEKDPSKRITVDQALSHKYFSESMDIQEPKMLKEITNLSMTENTKSLFNTPTTTSKKSEVRGYYVK